MDARSGGTSRKKFSVLSFYFLLILCISFLFLFCGMRLSVDFLKTEPQLTFLHYDAMSALFMVLPALLIVILSFSPFSVFSDLLILFCIFTFFGFEATLRFYQNSFAISFELAALFVLLSLYLFSFVYLCYISSSFSLLMIRKDMSVKYVFKSGKALSLFIRSLPGLLLCTFSALILCMFLLV